MRQRISLALLLLSTVLATVWTLYPQRRAAAPSAPPPGGLAFRILLGVGDRSSTTWDGSIRVSPGRVTHVQGWRFNASDRINDDFSWKASTRNAPGLKKKKKKGSDIVETGVIVTADSDATASFDIRTAQGNFTFKAADIPLGLKRDFLNGRVLIERTPSVTQLTRSEEEQDFPAIADTPEAIYVSYVEFTHSDRSAEARRTFTAAPNNFDFLARPSGGDQVLLLRYAKAQRTWSAPIPVSANKQDILRTAVAVDGKKRVWVFWSASQNGNFDLYAKSYDNNRWSAEIRLTSDPGTDVNPAAATDSTGRVWVTWQAFRNNNLEVLAAALDGDAFTKEATVSTSRQSDWDPAIATAPNGEVAIVWDTYDKGDYDVYLRRLKYDSQIRLDPSIPVAASQNFEARPTAAYDGQNRLWIAYETSGVKWGKDFGAYETSGVALYQGHTLQMKCFQGNRALTVPSGLTESLPGRDAAAAVRRRGRPADVPNATLPNPNLVTTREPSGTPQPPPLPMNSFPRVAADASGAVYLSYRTPAIGRTQAGSVWTQNISYWDGASWKGPVTVPNSDHLMDVRAAMTPTGPGRLMMITASDHRIAERAGDLQIDLFSAEIEIGAAVRNTTLRDAPAEKIAPPDSEAVAEKKQVSFIRGYRTKAGSDQLQLLRGEFHRHTEMSGDGGRDGPLIDAYRYMIDAASMDWGGCCDHDNGGGREYYWWIQQKLTDAYHLDKTYTAMFSHERSVRYPEGHRNVVMPLRGIRPLPRLPISEEDPSKPAPDTAMLYRYLRQYSGIVASHTSGTNMGTDWRDNDPMVEPVVEIYQGDRQNYEMPGAPRTNTANDSIGGWRPLGFVSLALQKGFRLGFQASSDHISTHMSYCNLWVTTPTREGVMEAFRKRRVYGATDNILADVRSGAHFMGEEFTVSQPPAIQVKLWGTANFAKVHIIRDQQYVYTIEPKSPTVDFTWRDTKAERGKTSYYYVRGEQADGEIVWVSPMWITYK